MEEDNLGYYFTKRMRYTKTKKSLFFQKKITISEKIGTNTTTSTPNGTNSGLENRCDLDLRVEKLQTFEDFVYPTNLEVKISIFTEEHCISRKGRSLKIDRNLQRDQGSPPIQPSSLHI